MPFPNIYIYNLCRSVGPSLKFEWNRLVSPRFGRTLKFERSPRIEGITLRSPRIECFTYFWGWSSTWLLTPTVVTMWHLHETKNIPDETNHIISEVLYNWFILIFVNSTWSLILVVQMNIKKMKCLSKLYLANILVSWNSPYLLQINCMGFWSDGNRHKIYK